MRSTLSIIEVMILNFIIILYFTLLFSACDFSMMMPPVAYRDVAERGGWSLSQVKLVWKFHEVTHAHFENVLYKKNISVIFRLWFWYYTIHICLFITITKQIFTVFKCWHIFANLYCSKSSWCFWYKQCFCEYITIL